MPYGKHGLTSPTEVHNEALRLAQRAVADVFDEVGDAALFPMSLKIISRLDDLKRVKRQRRSGGHGEDTTGGREMTIKAIQTDTACAETPMSDHVARFWQHLEAETVRILVDLRREVGVDAPDGPVVYWDGASFGDDVARALVKEHDEIVRLRAEVKRLRGIVAADMLETGSVGSGAYERTPRDPDEGLPTAADVRGIIPRS